MMARILLPEGVVRLGSRRRRLASWLGSRLKVRGSMSQKMISAPVRAMQPAVAKNVYGVVMTASPGPISMAMRMASWASVPEDIATANFAPMEEAKACSKFSTVLPRMNCWDWKTLRTFWMTSF